MKFLTDQDVYQTTVAYLTRDKDFGAIVFLEENISAGVILLRGKFAEVDSIHHELSALLKKYTEDKLHNYFCVVEKDSYRMRSLGMPGKLT
ncbi:MAG: hypothetical protein HZA14_04255 [Nitrospirae bacterium]|nr:hypothetical protein [Nitrospirota bacterium]